VTDLVKTYPRTQAKCPRLDVAAALLFGLIFTIALFASDSGWIWYIPAMAGAVSWAVIASATDLSRISIKFETTWVPALIVLSLASASVAWSPSRFISLFELQTFILLTIGISIFGGMKANQIQLSLSACLPVTGCMIVVGAIQWRSYGMLPRAHFSDPNLFAGLLLSTIAVSVGILYDRLENKKHTWREGLVGCALVLALAVAIATRSRGAWVSSIVATVIVLSLTRKQLNLSVKQISGIIGLIVALSIGGSFLKMQGDLAEHNGLGASIKSRLAMWQSTVDMIKDNPIEGVGLGLWHIAYPRYRQKEDTASAGYHAHNDYLEAWAVSGLAGGFSLLALPVLWLIGIWRSRAAKLTQPGLFVGVSVGAGLLCIQATITFIFHQSGVCLWAGALLGSIYGLQLAGPSPARHLTTLNLSQFVLPVLALGITTVNYLAMAPSLIISNKNGFEARHLSFLMDTSTLRTLAVMEPFSSSPYFALGHLSHLKGLREGAAVKKQRDYKAALSYYAMAQKIEPIQVTLGVREALILEDYPGLPTAAKTKLVEETFDKVLAQDPGMQVALKEYAKFLISVGKTEKAEQLIRRALNVTAQSKKSELVMLGTEVKTGQIRN